MRLGPSAALLLMLCAALAACKAKVHEDAAVEPRGGPRAHVIEDIPTLARARQIDTTGSGDAERVSWRVDEPYDSVIAYYRRLLPGMGWAVMSDQGDSAVTNLYARKTSKTLWIRFEKRSGTTTDWTIIGTDSSNIQRTTGKGKATTP